jgi:hypothetical protein
MLGMLAAAAGVASFTVSPTPAIADMPNVPSVNLTLGDAHNSTPHHPGDCSGAPGGGDVDCAQVSIPNYAPAYGTDFRICMQIIGREASGPSKVCTPWASQNGGLSPITVSHSGQFNTANITVEPNPNDSGDPNTFYTDVGAGVQLYYSKAHSDSCRGSSGMAWSYGPPSGWAYGEVDDDDPGCAQVGLRVVAHQNPSYDAQYASDALPSSLATPAALSGSVTMKNNGNAAAVWTSDRLVESHGDCSNYEPSPDSTCTETQTWESSAFKLKLIGSTIPGVSPGAATLYPYRRTVTLTYGSQSVQPVPCDPGDPTGGDGPILPLLQSLLNHFVPAAYADRTVCPLDPGGYVTTVSTSGSANVASGGSAEFPMNFGTLDVPTGDYTLTFRMIKTDGAAQGTDADGTFGETFTKHIHIQGGPGFSCTTQTLDQTARQGDPATYDISVNDVGGFHGTVTVTPSGLPANATGGAESVALPPAGDAFVRIQTASTTPTGTSTLTFTASAPGYLSKQCTSQLVVTPARPQEVLQLTLKAFPPNVLPNANTTLDWTVGGATSCTASASPVNSAWSGNLSANDVADGEHFRDTAPLNTTTTFSLKCDNENDTITQHVTVGVGPTPAAATLRIDPTQASVEVNHAYQFRAYYDPDGPGGQDEYIVTTMGSTQWNSGDTSIALPTQNKGEFQGMKVGGPASITAAYGGKTAQANLTVTACTQQCAVAQLYLVPTTNSTTVGGTATYHAVYDPNGVGPQSSTAKDVTQSADWTSGDTSIAVVIGKGIYQGEAPGTAPVSATYLGTPANGSLTVTCVGGSCTGGQLSVHLTGSSDGSTWLDTLQGEKPFGPIDLKANVSGGSGTYNYTFYCDRPDNNTNITSNGIAGKVDNTTDLEKIIRTACTFDGEATFHPKVIIESGSSAAQTHMTINVGPCTGPDCNKPLSCTFNASPTTLFTPPNRSTTLSWDCTKPAACRVNVLDTPRAGTQVASGGQTGSGSDKPPYTTTYRLNCDGFTADKKVRVFDVNTRIEVLPR